MRVRHRHRVGHRGVVRCGDRKTRTSIEATATAVALDDDDGLPGPAGRATLSPSVRVQGPCPCQPRGYLTVRAVWPVNETPVRESAK